jgi:hypothetical protein
MANESTSVISKARPKLRSAIDENGMRFFYDTTTRNLSFLQTASDLKKLGIQNNMFFLKLYDRNLIGVDPFSPNLSNELMDRINLECTLNPWYFQRECVRIPSQGGATGPGSGDMFSLHRGTLAICWCFFHSIDFYINMPRQCYKTHSVLSVLDWAYLFGTSNSQFNFSNKSQTDADDNLKKLKSQKDCLPIFMQQKFRFVEDSINPGELKLEKGTDNIRTIKNPITKNTIVSKPSARTLANADNLGRGNSAPIQYYDEVEFTDYIGTILKASGPAYYQAAQNAKKNGAVYCRIMTSTPGWADSQPTADMEEWRGNMATFTERLYDMDTKNISDYIAKNSSNNMVYIEFNYKQIGRDENWYQGMCKLLNGDKLTIKRELLLQRLSGNSKSPFDPEDLETINSYRSNPLSEYIIHNDFLLRVYTELDRTTPYIIGVDVCTGVNGDSTAITLLDPYTEKPCAILKTPLIDEIETSEILVEIVNKYCPKALLAIERNSIGNSVINILRRTVLCSRIYNDPTKMNDTPDDKLDRKHQLIKNAENRRYWGIYTEGNSREKMMEILLLRAINNKDGFVCNEIIDEMNSLIRKSSGRIEADTGKHDDAVMSYLIALYTLKYGHRLTRYGIIKGLRKEAVEAMQEQETKEDPVAMWEALPEAYKRIFPKPGSGTLIQGVSAEGGDVPKEFLDEVRKEDNDDQIYRNIESAQMRRARHRTAIDPNAKVDVDAEYIEDMIRQANDKDNTMLYDNAFDICDLLNK